MYAQGQRNLWALQGEMSNEVCFVIYENSLYIFGDNRLQMTREILPIIFKIANSRQSFLEFDEGEDTCKL